jgi:hypothetical protein
MHPLFTHQWALALGAALESSAMYREAARRWDGAVCLQRIADTSTALPSTAVFLDLKHGHCHAARLATEADLKQAKFVISGPLTAWLSVLRGNEAPTVALMRAAVERWAHQSELVGLGALCAIVGLRGEELAQLLGAASMHRLQDRRGRDEALRDALQPLPDGATAPPGERALPRLLAAVANGLHSVRDALGGSGAGDADARASFRLPLTRLLLAEAPEAPEQAGVLFITLAAPASAPAEAAAAAGGEGGDATIALALNFVFNQTSAIFSFLVALLSQAVTGVAIALVYWLVVGPTGLLVRLFGQDDLKRRLVVGSTFQDKDPPDATEERFLRQY